MPDVVASVGQNVSHPQNVRNHSQETSVSPNNSSWNSTADEKATDKVSRSAIHRRKTNMHRGFQAFLLDTDQQKTTSSVLTKHSTAE